MIEQRYSTLQRPALGGQYAGTLHTERQKNKKGPKIDIVPAEKTHKLPGICYLQKLKGESRAKQISRNRVILAPKTPQIPLFQATFGPFLPSFYPPIFGICRVPRLRTHTAGPQ